MLTKPLAKFNSTFSVGVSGNKYAIIGKQIGTANPTLTLNAMGINYENSSISSEELVRGPDYKEFTVKENIPIIRATTNLITFGTSNSLELSGDRSIHRVYFSNIGCYVIQSEKYSGNDDYSSVVGYGFQPMNTNLERYGDLVELFRFVTVGVEEEGDFINVYQAIGSGIPPVDSFGVVPEVNYVSREGSNNIQFTDSNNNYFTLVGQNYSNSPKKVYFNFRSELDEEGYNVLFNDTLFDGYLGSINFRDAGSDTNYSFTPDNLSLELSSSRYIKMGNVGGFQGIELKNDNSIISMNNDGLGLRNGESSIVLDDSTQNINLNAASDISLSGNNVTVNSSEKFELSSGDVTKIQGDDSGLAIETSLDSRARGKITVNPSTVTIDAGSTTYGNNRITLTSSNLKFSKDEVDYLTVSNTGVLSSYSPSESGSSNLNWKIEKDYAYFPSLHIANPIRRLVFLNNVKLTSDMGTIFVAGGPTVLR